VNGLFCDLIQLCKIIQCNLECAVNSKMLKNELKYPAKQCFEDAKLYDHIEKYTKYNKDVSCFREHSNSCVKCHDVKDKQLLWIIQSFSSCLTYIVKKAEKFGAARGWSKYYTPRNITLALIGELGELTEILQF